MTAVIEVNDLHVTFASGAPVLRDVNFAVESGETLAIVGESGSGKSTLARTLLGLTRGRCRIRGEVRFDGLDLVGLDDASLNRLRGNQLSIVFQDALAALNPVMRVDQHLVEVMRVHGNRAGRDELRARSIELLDQVGIAEPARRLRSYPHELSGGMRQRVLIALALANRPRLVIADEPTTSLDVSVQAQVLGELAKATEGVGCALVLVTHDLGVVAEMADRVAVMYAGRIVELAPVEQLFDAPRHPYTAALLAARPALGEERGELLPITGAPPRLDQLPAGCPFAPRCTNPERSDRCVVEQPQPRHLGADRFECHHPLENAVGAAL